MKISAVIMAGGRSTRMGRDKAFLKLDRLTWIDRLARELSELGDVYISAAHAEDYADRGLPVLGDVHHGIGPIEGLRQSLRHAREDYVFVCAVDMPFVREGMALYLAEFITPEYDAWVFREGERIHPLCGLYHRRVLPVIEDMITEGNYRLTELLSRTRTKYVNIHTSCFPADMLRNINTPEEYLALRKPLVFCVSGVKNSGKTGLVERLIPALSGRGMSAGVIKHDGHSFECDVPGTDSDRFYRAGAAATAVYSRDQTFVRERRQADVGELIRRMGDVDVILIEGLKYSPFPKVETIRGEVSCRSVCDPRTLLCVAADTPLSEPVPCPVFDLDDTEGILQCVLGKLWDDSGPLPGTDNGKLPRCPAAGIFNVM